MELRNATILITGANGVLGQALAKTAVARGAGQVYACMRDPKLTRLSDPKISPVEMDVADALSVERATKLIGPVDIVVSNAGLAKFGSVLDRSIGEQEAEMKVNYWGALSVLRAQLPEFLARSRGCFVIINSLAGLAGLRQGTGYGASKSALHNLTQSIRAQFTSKGVEVIGVYPGPIDTPMADGFPGPKADPLTVAEEIWSGVDQGKPYIFPDAVSQQLGPLWQSNPLGAEQVIGAI